MKGTVQWFNARKGYGFIQGEDGNDVFVHQTAVPMGVFLTEGDEVEYQKENSDRGPRAVEVRRV